MREELLQELREIGDRLAQLSDAILSEEPCRLFSALREVDGGSGLKISGNSEGLVYLASILVGLATDRSPGQHFHFGEGEVLDEADRELILEYEPAEWDAP
jgi:hypothetical protein